MANRHSEQPNSSQLVAARQQAKFIEDIMKEQNVKKYSSGHQGLVEVKESQPSFLTAFYEPKTPVVVVSAKKSEQVPMAPTCTVKAESAPAQMLEVTGTPLEAPFSADDLCLINNVQQPVEPEIAYEPLDNNYARILLFRYAETIGSNCKHHNIPSDDIVPVFVVCDGSDRQKFVLLVSESNGTARASRMFADQEEKCGDKKMVDLRRKAQQTTRVYVWPGGKLNQMPSIETVRYLEFCGLVRQVSLEDGSKTGEDCGLKVKAIWKVRGDSLDAPAPLGAVCALEYCLGRECLKLETGTMLAEISLLLQLTKHLEDSTLPDLQLAFVPGHVSDLDPLDLARDIMLQCHAVTTSSNNLENKVHTLQELIASVCNESRPNMDLTDVVWNSFKHIKSLSSVTDCLQAVFQEFLTSKPYLQPNNPTKLAKLLLQTLDFEDVVERLPVLSQTPQLAATMFLEVGYTKLCRDLAYICEASGLRNSEATREACGISLTSWPEKVQRLLLLQRVLELVVRAQETLELGPDALRIILDKALQNPPGNLLRVNLTADHLCAFLNSEGSRPVLRRWSFKSFNETTKSTVTAHFACSQNPIFPWQPSKLSKSAGPNSSLDATLEPQEAVNEMYCSTLYHIINP